MTTPDPSQSSRRFVAVMMVAALAVQLVGCVSGGRYRSGGVFPAEINTIAVPILENRTLATGVEREITDALIKEIHARTPYRVVGSEAADTVLTGTVVQVSKEMLSEQRGSGLAQEMLYSVTIDFQWTDQRTGEILVERLGFRTADLYIPTLPVSERPEFAEYRVAEELARDVVAAMRDDW